jgi:ABC-type phosphate transport system substrate-binding protein
MKINFGKKTIVAGAVVSSLLAVVLLANAVFAATTTWTVSDANLKVSGSTTCFPIFSYVLGLQQGATYGRGTGGTFQQNKAGASTIVADLEQSSSGQGLSDTTALNGDLGLSSSINSALLPLPSNVTMTEFARDGVCIIANSSVTGTANITFDEIARIFGSVSGQSAITTWSSMHITSSTDNIVVFGRQSGSGTEDTINKCIAGGGFSGWTDNNSNITRETSSALLLAAVSSTPGAIGYESYGYVSQNLGTNVLFSISPDSANWTYPYTNTSSYVAPTAQSITSTSYPLARTLKFLKNTTPSTNSDNANLLISYTLSRLGQDDVEHCGFVKLNPDADVNADGHINISDVGSIGTKWLQSGANGFCAQDVNQDGHVNISDIGKIGQWWLISYTRIGS